MKKILLAMALFATTLNATAQTDEVTVYSGSKVKKTDMVSEARKCPAPIDEISVNLCIRLTVENRTTGNIVITANEQIMPLLEIKMKENKLTVRLDDKAVRALGRKCLNEDYLANVSVPNNGMLKSLKCSGSSSITVLPLITAPK